MCCVVCLLCVCWCWWVEVVVECGSWKKVVEVVIWECVLCCVVWLLVWVVRGVVECG